MQKEVIGDCTLYCADNREIMTLLQDKSVDWLFTDPPYFDGPNKSNYYGEYVSNVGVPRGQYKEIQNWFIPDNAWYKEALRISKEQIIWGINYFEFAGQVKGRIIWDKNNHFSSFSKAEIASCSNINIVQMERYTWNGMIQQDMKNREKRVHPTQKPVPLMTTVLRKYAKPEKGSIVVDGFMGSGSLGIAAVRCGCKFIGVEIEPHYFDLACRRIEMEIKQGRLFEEKSSYECRK